MLIDDIEYVLFRHRDPAAAREFMRDYGLVDLGEVSGRSYMRTYGDAPFSWVTSEGEPAFLGMGFRVASEAALEELAKKFDTAVAPCPHPGGGRYVVTEIGRASCRERV